MLQCRQKSHLYCKCENTGKIFGTTDILRFFIWGEGNLDLRQLIGDVSFCSHPPVLALTLCYLSSPLSFIISVSAFLLVYTHFKHIHFIHCIHNFHTSILFAFLRLLLIYTLSPTILPSTFMVWMGGRARGCFPMNFFQVVCRSMSTLPMSIPLKKMSLLPLSTINCE